MKRSTVSDRRSTRRHEVVQSAILYAENAPTTKPGLAVQLNNISANGLLFDSLHPCPVGSIFRVIISGDALQLDTAVRIIRCRKCDGQYSIGAEFIDETA